MSDTTRLSRKIPTNAPDLDPELVDHIMSTLRELTRNPLIELDDYGNMTISYPPLEIDRSLLIEEE